MLLALKIVDVVNFYAGEFFSIFFSLLNAGSKAQIPPGLEGRF
jgi:hypothetical protein